MPWMRMDVFMPGTAQIWYPLPTMHMVRWEISDGIFCLHTVTPEGVVGEVILPDGKSYRAEAGSWTFECISGNSV